MPFRSQAQMRKFDELLRDGRITREQYDQWHAETPDHVRAKLPERIHPKKTAPTKRAA